MEQNDIRVVDENNKPVEIIIPEESLLPSSGRKSIFRWIIYSFLVIAALLVINYNTTAEFINSLTAKAGIKEYNQGVEYMSENKTKMAEEMFNRAITKNPDLAEAYLMLGSIYTDKGLLGHAEIKLSQCILILNKQMSLSEASFSKKMLSSALFTMYKVEYKNAKNAKARQKPEAAKFYMEMAEKYLNVTIYYDPGNQEAKDSLKEIAPFIQIY